MVQSGKESGIMWNGSDQMKQTEKGHPPRSLIYILVLATIISVGVAGGTAYSFYKHRSLVNDYATLAAYVEAHNVADHSPTVSENALERAEEKM